MLNARIRTKLDNKDNYLDWLFFKLLEIACFIEEDQRTVLLGKHFLISNSEIKLLLDKARLLRFEALLAKALLLLGYPEQKWMSVAKAAALYRSFVYSEALQILSQYLSKKSIDYAFLKGCISDLIFYGGRGLRGTSDVDLWLCTSSELDLQQLIHNFSWQPLLLDGFEATVDASHGRPYRWNFMGQEILVDVHKRLTDPPIPNFPTLTLQRIRSYSVQGYEFAALSFEDWLVYSAANLAVDGLSGRVKLALDVAQIIYSAQKTEKIRDTIDELLLYELAVNIRVKHALWGLLMLVKLKFGKTLSVKLLKKLEPPVWKRRWVLSLFGADQNPLQWRGMPVRLLLPDQNKENIKAFFRWWVLRLKDQL